MTAEWKLNCPAPDFGTIADGVFNMGPVLMDDQMHTTEQDAKMQIVSGVNRQDFEHYVQTVLAAGGSKTFENNNQLDSFWGFTLNGTSFQASFRSVKRELRVCEDPLVTPMDAFNYSVQGSRQTVLYQYGLYFDPDNRCTDKTMNCGMMYIVRLSDNGLFLIDSGHLYQWNQQAFDALWSFLHEITDTPENEKLRIAGWYFTHAHNDHTDGCGCLLNRYHDKITVERIFHGFCSYQVHPNGYELESQDTKRLLLKYFPDAMQLRVHTGQRIRLADVEIEVLYAHEDAVSADAPEELPLRDFNSTSSIIRVHIGKKSVIFLGDATAETERVVSGLSVPELWKADAVQVGHHCINYLELLYSWIGAPMALMPNSYYGCHTEQNLRNLSCVLKHLKNDQIYYEGSGTYGFADVDGQLQPIAEVPLTGGPYDGYFD